MSADDELEQLRAEVKALRAAIASYRTLRAGDAQQDMPANNEGVPSIAYQDSITLTEFPHVIKVKGKHGGSPLMKESYISVKTIAVFTKMGYSPAKIVAEYVGELNLAEVHEALAYYYRHIDEIESYLEADERAEIEFRQRAQTQTRNATG